MTLVATAADARQAAVARPLAVVSPDTDVGLDVSPETSWTVVARAEGYWSAATALSPGVRLDLWPIAIVRGQVLLAEAGASVPESIVVGFRNAPTRNPQDVVPRGSVSCPVLETRFACDLPAARLDLDVRLKGHAARYLWDQALTAGAALDLGGLPFTPGASLTGRVRQVPDGPGPDPVRLSLRPLTPPSSGSAGPAASRPVEVTVLANERGFFQFVGVPPGRYVVAASTKGMLPNMETVVIVEGMEASLREPLTLSPPRTLEILLQPPSDPSGRAWKVSLLRERGGERTVAETSFAGSNGVWRGKDLTGGEHYLVTVATASDELWYRDESPFTLDSPVSKRTLLLVSEDIRGLLTLGKEPLAATLTFGAGPGGHSAVVKSNEKGSFRAILPRLGLWSVAVESHSPPVRRVLEVTVSRSRAGDDADFEIHLPSDALEGEVVDKQGPLVDGALLTIKKRFSRELIQRSLEAGSFRLEGLDEGEYEVRAESRRMESKVHVVTIADHEVDPSFLRIVVSPRRGLRGKITSPLGPGVLDATVQVFRPGGTPGMLTPPTRVDAEGRFTSWVSEELSEVCLGILAPGFAARVLRVAVTDDEQPFQVDSKWGALVVDQPADPAAFLTKRPVVYRNGCALFPGQMNERWDRGKDRTLVTASTSEPGDYAVCMLGYQEMENYSGGRPSFPSCVHGSLFPGGSLTLKVKQ